MNSELIKRLDAAIAAIDPNGRAGWVCTLLRDCKTALCAQDSAQPVAYRLTNEDGQWSRWIAMSPNSTAHDVRKVIPDVFDIEFAFPASAPVKECVWRFAGNDAWMNGKIEYERSCGGHVLAPSKEPFCGQCGGKIKWEGSDPKGGDV